MSGADSDIEILEESTVHDKYTPWLPLRYFLVKNNNWRKKHQQHKSQRDRLKVGNQYLDAWILAGFTYGSLKDTFRKHLKAVEQRTTAKDALQKKLWKKVSELKAHKKEIALVSASTLVDRSFEHFQAVFKKEENDSDGSTEYVSSPTLEVGSHGAAAPLPPGPPPPTPPPSGYRAATAQPPYPGTAPTPQQYPGAGMSQQPYPSTSQGFQPPFPPPNAYPPTFHPNQQPPYHSGQPGYSTGQPGYGTAPVQPGYGTAPPPTQPGYAEPHQGYSTHPGSYNSPMRGLAPSPMHGSPGLNTSLPPPPPVQRHPDSEFVQFATTWLSSRGVRQTKAVIDEILHRLASARPRLDIQSLVEFYCLNKVFYDESKPNISAIIVFVIEETGQLIRLGLAQEQLVELLTQFSQMNVIQHPDLEARVRQDKNLRQVFEHILVQATGTRSDHAFPPSGQPRLGPQTPPVPPFTPYRGGPAPRGPPQRGAPPPHSPVKGPSHNKFPMDAARFKFQSYSNEIENLKGYILRDRKGLVGRESEYLKIGVELKIVGNGLVDNVLLEMGVSFPDGRRKFFYVGDPTKANIATHTLKNMGYSPSDGCFYRDERGRPRKEQVLAQHKIIDHFIFDLKTAIGQSDWEGFIISVLNVETLIELLKIVVQSGEKTRTEFLKIFKGYCVLEPLIRTTCLRGGDNNSGIVRISHTIAAEIFSLKMSRYQDEMASNTISMIGQLRQAGEEVRSSAINSALLDLFERFNKDLTDMTALARFISKSVQARGPALSRLIDPFPRPAELAKPKEEVAALVVHVLLFNNINTRNLAILAEGEPNQFMSRLNRVLHESLRRMSSEESKIMELAIGAVVQSTNDSGHHQSRSPNCEGARSRHPSADSYDSEGSMPADEGRNSPIKDQKFRALEAYLSAELQAKRAYTRLQVLQVSNFMVRTLIQHFRDYGVLEAAFTDNQTAERRELKLGAALVSLASGEKPKDWLGFSIKDLLQHLESFFNTRTEYKDKDFIVLEKYLADVISSDRRQELSNTAKNIARSLVLALETIGYTYNRLMKKISGLGNSLLFQPQIEHQLSQKFSVPDARWAGYTPKFIVENTLKHFKELSARSSKMKQEFNSESGDRDRKRPSSDGRESGFGKRRRPDEAEDGWAGLKSGLADEMTALVGFCNRYKRDNKNLGDFTARALIQEMAQEMETGSQLALNIVKRRMEGKDSFGKDQEAMKLANQIFKGMKNPRAIFYKSLFLRFCSYLSDPARMEKDAVDADPDPVVLGQQPEQPFIPTLESIEDIISELQRRYNKYLKSVLAECGKHNVRGQDLVRRLHEYLYYSQNFLRLSLNTASQTRTTAATSFDLIKHIISLSKDDLTALKAKIAKAREETKIKRELHAKMTKILKVDKFPRSCESITGLLVSVVAEFFDQILNAVPISKEVLAVHVVHDETNGLTDFQEYLFHLYLEESLQMEADGDLVGMRLEYVDVAALSRSVHTTVNFLLDSGFQLYAAIEHYIKGTLSEWLNQHVKPHESSNPEATNPMLLVRLVSDYIDSKIKIFKVKQLPQAKTNRRTLKTKVVSLIKNGEFLVPEAINKVEVSLVVPRMEQETLVALTEDAIKEEEVAGADAVAPLVAGEIVTIKDETETLRRELVPGSVTTNKVIIIPPRSGKTFYATVTGLPSLKGETQLTVISSKETVEKGLHLRNQVCTLQADLTVLIRVDNTHATKVAKLDKGFIVGLAKVNNPGDVESDSPGFCLQFVRYYYQAEGLVHIQLKGIYFCFGPNKEIKIDKDRRTNFKIFGTLYSCGLQDYYTLEAVVYFLNQMETLDFPYQDYVKLCLKFTKQIVREKDYQDMWKYLHGVIAICPQIDKEFTDKKNKELNFLFLQSHSIDSDLNLPNIKANLKEEEESAMEVVGTEVEKVAGIDEEKVDNPNKKVITSLKTSLVLEWEMSTVQATHKIELLVTILKELGLSMSQIRIDYFGVPNHRDLYKSIMKDKVCAQLAEMDVGAEKNNIENMEITAQAFKYRSVPSTVRELSSILALSKYFEADLIAHNQVEMMERNLTSLKSLVEDRETSHKLDFDEDMTIAFQTLVEGLSAVVSCRPPASTGSISVYTATSNNSLFNLVVQRQDVEDSKLDVVVGFNSRILSPKESKLSFDQKSLLGAMWAVNVNKSNLFGEQFVLMVSNRTASQMLNEDDEISRMWINQLADFTFTTQFIRESENPALGFGPVDHPSLENRPFCTASLISDLFIEMLNAMKTNAKSRYRWLKYKMKCEKRKMQEAITRSGSSEWGNLDIEMGDAIAHPTVRALSRAREQPGIRVSVQAGPTINFIAAASSTHQEEEGDVAEAEASSAKIPQFLDETYQPLFEAFFASLHGSKGFDWSSSEEIATKVMTRLYINSVSYVKLKESVADLGEPDTEVATAHAQDVVGMLLNNNGLQHFNQRDELIKVTVDHFFGVLRLRPKITVNVTSRPEVIEVPKQTADGDPYADVEKQTVTAAKSDWFLDLVEEMEDDRPQLNNRVSWAKETITPPPRIVEAEQSGDLDDLVHFFDKRISNLERADKDFFRAKDIGGAEFRKNWSIAGVDYKQLENIHRQNSDNKAAITDKFKGLLAVYKAVLVKHVDVNLLVEWTAAFFSIQFNNQQGNVHMVNQKNQLLRLQQECVPASGFVELQRFLASIMISVHGRNIKQADRYTSACMQAMTLIGLRGEVVSELFLAGAEISACTMRLYDTLMKIFNSVVCIISPLVDVERLIKYTSVFYRVEAKLRELLREGSLLAEEGVADRQTSLLPLVTNAIQRLDSEYNTAASKRIGTVSLREMVHIPADDFKEVSVKINLTLQFPLPDNTPILIQGNEFMSLNHSLLQLEEQKSRYAGESIEVCLTNKDEHKSASLGHPSISKDIGVVYLDGFDREDLHTTCQKFSFILAEIGVQYSSLIDLCHDIVKDTKGVSQAVLVLALSQGFHRLVRSRADKMNMLMFDRFIRIIILACLKQKRPRLEEDKLDIKTEVGMEVDVEEGEVESDDDDYKVLEGAGGVVEEDLLVEEEGGLLVFPGCQIDTQDLLNPPVKQVEEIEILAVLKSNCKDIDLSNKINGKVLAGRHLVDPARILDIRVEGTTLNYDIQTIILFLRFVGSSHPVYVKKVKAQFPDNEVVLMDHRIRLQDYLADPPALMVEAEVMTREQHFRRLYTRFEELMSGLGAPETIPTSKIQEFQPLYNKYFTHVYTSGLTAQVNWLDVSRVCTEELVNTWTTAKYSMDILLRKQKKACQERGEARRNEKYKKVFKFHLKKLRGAAHRISQTIDIKSFIKESMEHVDEILLSREIWLDQERRENLEITISDEEEDDDDVPEIIEPKENQDGGCENAAEAQIKDGGDNAGSDSDDADGHLIEKLKEVPAKDPFDLDESQYASMKESLKLLRENMGRADQPKVQEIVPEVYQLEIASDLLQEGVQQDVVETAMLPEADIPEVDRPETDIPDVSDMPDEDERYPELQDSPSASGSSSPSGSQTSSPAGSRANSPSGSQAGFQAGSRANSPAGSQASSQYGSRVNSPTGSQASSPYGSRANSPAGSRASSPHGFDSPEYTVGDDSDDTVGADDFQDQADEPMDDDEADKDDTTEPMELATGDEK